MHTKSRTSLKHFNCFHILGLETKFPYLQVDHIFQPVLGSLILHNFPGKIIANVSSYSQMDPVWATNYLSLCFCGLRFLGCLASL